MLRRGLINQIGNIVKSGVAGTWAELIGTVNEYFQIGDGGIRLKKSGTDTLQIRNSDDSADGNLTVKQLEVIATDTYKTTVSMGTGATENQAFVFPSSPGADGQALLTNGGGSMSWGSPGGSTALTGKEGFILTGTGSPSNDIGSRNDVYIDTNNGNVYKKDSITESADLLTGGSVTDVSNETESYPATKAVDDDESTPTSHWYAGDFNTEDQYFVYDLGAGNSEIVNKVRILPNNTGTIKDFKFQGSNDGANWTDIVTGTHGNNSDWEAFENIGNSAAYRYFRMFVVDTYTAVIQIREMEAIGYTAFAWSQISNVYARVPGHGEMCLTENTTAFTIDAADEWHLLNGLTEGTNEGFTFDAGGSASISAFADYSGTVSGTVQVTTATAHGITTSGIVSITGTTNYDGVYEATVIDTTNFYVTATWVSDDATGTVNHGSSLSVDTNYGDVYLVIWSASMKATTASEVFDFELYINASGMTVTERRNDFDNNTDYQTVAGNGIITVSDGDVITFAVKNVGNSGDITLRHLNVTLNKV